MTTAIPTDQAIDTRPFAAQFTEAADLIRAATRIALITHVQPDGDAIGSMLGMAHALHEMGKQVIPSVDGGCPPRYRFLPNWEWIVASLEGQTFDLFISCDSSDEKRTGEVGKQARAYAAQHGLKSVNLDHHVTNTNFATANIWHPRYVSTTETVLHLLDFIGHPLSKATADCLFCGLVTDSLGFRISAVKPETFAQAGRLMAAGADLTRTMENTLNRMATEALRLWARALPSLQIADHVGWVQITIEDQRASGVLDADVGGSGNLVSQILQADDVFVAATFREKAVPIGAPPEVEISLRAKPGYNVADVAFSVGGGGHTQASGATISGTLDTVQAQVIPMLVKAAREGSGRY